MAAITQLQLQTGIKTILDAVSGFASAAQIEGDELLDGSAQALPYAQILTASNYDLQPAPARMIGTISIPAILYFEFDDWQTTDNAIRNLETNIFEHFNTTGGWTLGLEKTQVRRIVGQDIGYVYHVGTTEGTDPVFLTRTLEFVIELF